ncbi:MAG: hypothetical protein DCF20_06145 [Pseudanabaena sp.]|nr:MAG: hypothetical protein DCF20_06145 [Pseudanabaena sp.]
MFKRPQNLSRSVYLSQLLLGVSCLLIPSAIANPISIAENSDRANVPQETIVFSDRLDLEVSNSVAPEKWLTTSPNEINLADKSSLLTPNSQPLPIQKAKPTQNTDTSIFSVADLTIAPTSLESFKLDQKITTPPLSLKVAQENAQNSQPKPAPVQQPADDSNAWHFKLQPYAPVPLSVNGSVTIGDRSLSFSSGLSGVLDALDLGLFGRFEAWNNNLGFIVDASIQTFSGYGNSSRDFNRLQTDLSVGASFTQGIYDFAISYHLGDPAQYSLPDKPSNKSFPQVWVEPIVGVRINTLDASLDAGLDLTFQRQRFDRSFQRTVSRSRTWLEPMVGAKFGVQVSDPVTLWLRGDASGFGLAGSPDLQWNIITGADWWISPTTTLQIGYKFYEINYGNNDQSFKYSYNGPYLGVTFNF